MRKPLYCLLTLVLVASSAKGVSSSPDCQRWLSDYKKALAQKQATQHLLAARNRARAAARRRLARLTRPTGPTHPPTRISSVRPHLSPSQMLKRFDLLCGELPVENQVLDSRMLPDEFISEVAMGGPVDLEGSPADGTLLAENAVPVLPLTPVNPEVPGQAFPQIPVFGPVFGGAPAGFGSPSGPGTPSKPGSPLTGGTPGGPTSPGVPTSPGAPNGPSTPPAPPLAPVPEPSSIFLMLTGLFGAGAFGVKRAFH